MGSPYAVSVSSRVHVIRTVRGYINLRKEILRSCTSTHDPRLGSGPAGAMIYNFDAATHNAILQSCRTVVILEARYEWTGFEKFNRVVVLDFSRCARLSDSGLRDVGLNQANEYTKFSEFHRARLTGCEEGEDSKLFSYSLKEVPLYD